MRGQESFKLTAGGTGASAEFQLYGGRYQVSVASATFGGGNVVLQQLGSDNVTWLPVNTPLTAVGVNVVEVPPGKFRLFSVTAIAIEAAVVRIPGE